MSLPSVASSSLKNANWNGDKMDDLPKQIVKPSGIDPFIRLASLKFKYRTRKRKGTNFMAVFKKVKIGYLYREAGYNILLA